MLTALGAYIFAGGFSLGVERHMRVLAHLESGMYGVKTYKLNRPHVPVYVGSKNWPTEMFRGRVNFVFTNPPCALFSSAGASIKNGKDNWRTDPRQSCIHECFGLLEKIQPDVLAIESVTNAFTRGRELFDELAKKANDQGYAVTHVLENSCWYTVPQVRRRYFFVAHRHAFKHWPLNWAPPTTVREVLQDVREPGWHRPLKDKQVELYSKLQFDQGTREVWDKENPPETHVRSRFGVKGRPRMMEKRIPLDRPMGAFVGDFHIHPTEPRPLGLNEAKALCGFPPNFQFHKQGGAYSELARGVMPNVGEWLARSAVLTIQEKRQPVIGTKVLDLQRPPQAI